MAYIEYKPEGKRNSHIPLFLKFILKKYSAVSLKDLRISNILTLLSSFL